jgi:tRNA-dihydrouridine synthase B
VSEIKARLRIPVFANGDIDSPAKARSVLTRTGVDGVMIGRAALGAPWLLGMMADPTRREPSVAAKWGVMLEHVAAMHVFYGDKGVRIARKHVQWYLAGLMPGAEAAKVFHRLEDAQEQLSWLRAQAEKVHDSAPARVAA